MASLKISRRVAAILILLLLAGAGGVGVLFLLPSGPHARFWQSAEALSAGELLLLDARNSSGKEPLVYSWDLGDGTTGTGAQTTHVYSQPGSYEILLRVTDAEQRQDEARGEAVVSSLSVATARHRLGEGASYLASGHLSYTNLTGLPLLGTGDPSTEIYLIQLSATISGSLDYVLTPGLQSVDGFNQTQPAFAYGLSSPLVVSGSATLRLFFGTSTVPFSAWLNLTLRDLHAESTNLTFRIESTLRFTPVLQGAMPIPLNASEDSVILFPVSGSQADLISLLDPTGGREVALGESISSHGLNWTAKEATNVGGAPAITLELNGTEVFGGTLSVSLARDRSVPVRMELMAVEEEEEGFTLHVRYDLEQFTAGSADLPPTILSPPGAWPVSVATRLGWGAGQLLPRLGDPPSAAEAFPPEIVEGLLALNSTVSAFRAGHPGAAIAEATLGLDEARSPQWELLLVDGGTDAALRISLTNVSGMPQISRVIAESSSLDPILPQVGELRLTWGSVERVVAQFADLRSDLLQAGLVSLSVANFTYGLAPADPTGLLTGALPSDLLRVARLDGTLSAFVDARSGQLVAIVRSTGAFGLFG